MSENKNEIPKNVLHGVTLEAILIDLVEYVGWEKMASKIPIRCFEFDPHRVWGVIYHTWQVYC
jgi:uncharacterized protein (DUF2132 family)